MTRNEATGRQADLGQGQLPLRQQRGGTHGAAAVRRMSRDRQGFRLRLARLKSRAGIGIRVSGLRVVLLQPTLREGRTPISRQTPASPCQEFPCSTCAFLHGFRYPPTAPSSSTPRFYQLTFSLFSFFSPIRSPLSHFPPSLTYFVPPHQFQRHSPRTLSPLLRSLPLLHLPLPPHVPHWFLHLGSIFLYSIPISLPPFSVPPQVPSSNLLLPLPTLFSPLFPPPTHPIILHFFHYFFPSPTTHTKPLPPDRPA